MTGQRHVSSIQLRVADINFSGHLDNISIMRMIDEARTHFLGFRGTHEDRFSGGLLEVCGPGVGTLVAQQSIAYIEELWFDLDEPVEVTMWISHLGGASFVLACELRQRAGAPVAVRAECSVVVIGLESKRPWRIPPELRPHFEAYLGPAVKLRPRRS